MSDGHTWTGSETPPEASAPSELEGALFPPAVARALNLPPGVQTERGWDTFLEECGDLILRTDRYGFRDEDASMDAYAFILEKLRTDDLKRLKSFPGGDRTYLAKWVVVVSRRLASDFRRRRYGRARPGTPPDEMEARRRLIDGIWDKRESAELPARDSADPERVLRRRERERALDAALAEVEPRDRLLLAFRFQEGLSARRIAELMRYPTPFHVYRRLNRVLDGLRKRLLEHGIDGPDP